MSDLQLQPVHAAAGAGRAHAEGPASGARGGNTKREPRAGGHRILAACARHPRIPYSMLYIPRRRYPAISGMFFSDLNSEITQKCRAESLETLRCEKYPV